MRTVKERLKGVVDKLSDEDAAQVLRFTRWLRGEEGEVLTPGEYKALDRGLAQLRAGKARPWREIRRTPA